MNKKSPRQLYGAIIFTAVVLALLVFLNKNQDSEEVASYNFKKPSRNKESVLENTTTLENNLVGETSRPNETVYENQEKPVSPLNQKELLDEFKKLIELEVNLPENFIYSTSDIDGAAAITGIDKQGETLSVLATNKKLTPEAIAEILHNNKSDFPFLRGHSFNIKGNSVNIQPQSGSGISKITLMDGGGGYYGVVCERIDGRGTYLFVLKTDPNQFEAVKKEALNLIQTISTK